MDEARKPTIEGRIKAAMELAGLDFPALAARIATPNYGERTLRKIAEPNDHERPARTPDLHLIGRACGVSDAFWTIDFSRLEDDEPALRDQLRALEARFDQLAANTASQMAQQEQALQEHRERDHQGEAGEGEAQ